MTWYLIQTKPRSEKVALENLTNQGYECYLPMMRVEKIINKQIEVQKVPLFPRYLFINLDIDFESKSWTPIRSTRGVSNLVRFGEAPAKIHDVLVQNIYSREHQSETYVQPLFRTGEILKIVNGPFAGFESIYQGMAAEKRVMILLEFMRKPLLITLELDQIKKVMSANAG
jgi:transcriptional antiterminator RfaH